MEDLQQLPFSEIKEYCSSNEIKCIPFNVFKEMDHESFIALKQLDDWGITSHVVVGNNDEMVYFHELPRYSISDLQRLMNGKKRKKIHLSIEQ